MGDEGQASKHLIGELRRPFMPASISFKVQTNPKPKQGGGKTKAMAVAFISSRHVSARLNVVCPDMWEDNYVTPPPPLGTGLVCELRIGDRVRKDIGFSRDLTSDMGVKALFSDAFKRAGVKWGVGEFLYALPRSYVDAEHLLQRGDKWFMPDRTVTMLRGEYAKWLKSPAAKEFGDPLDHGDAEDPQGDTEDEGDGRHIAEPASGLPVTDETVDRLSFLYAAIQGKNAKALTKAAWALIQKRANEDEDGYNESVEHLKGIYESLGGDLDAVAAEYRRLRAVA